MAETNPHGHRKPVCRGCADRLTELEVGWIVQVERGVRHFRNPGPVPWKAVAA